MAEFDDNDELARLRQWWASNGAALVIGALVGLLALGGWYGWHWYQNRQAAQAADIYAQIEHGIDTDNVTAGVVDVVGKLEAHYSGTPYAAGAALDIAAYYVKQKQYDKAGKQLDWALNNANNDGIRNIARVRKARVLWAQSKPKAALQLLNTQHPDSFDSLYAELAGDIHAAQGDRTAAYQSYQQALQSLPQDAPSQPLQTKMSNVAPASEAGATPPSSQSTTQETPSKS